MPRMFDILKNSEVGPATPRESQDGKSDKEAARPLSFPKEILKSEAPPPKEKEDTSIISKKLISAIKQHGVDNQERADNIYEGAVEIVKELLVKIKNDEDLTVYMERISELLDAVFNQLVMGDNILSNIYERKKEEPFLPHHIVNVFILSSVLGLKMGFNKSNLSHLGMASIFYDVGIEFFMDIVDLPRVLTDEERKAVRAHTDKSLMVVEKIGGFNEVVKETIRMHHERISGLGYPAGIKNEAINPYASIIGLVDTYEAMTHTRPYRDGMNSHKAVRLLLSAFKADFDVELMKIFINKMSVYPIGSIITLETGEAARVVSVQPGSPLRPVVMVLRDSSGANARERVIIDLSKQDFPAIKE